MDEVRGWVQLYAVAKFSDDQMHFDEIVHGVRLPIVHVLHQHVFLISTIVALQEDLAKITFLGGVDNYGNASIPENHEINYNQIST